MVDTLINDIDYVSDRHHLNWERVEDQTDEPLCDGYSIKRTISIEMTMDYDSFLRLLKQQGY